ncbi:MAG: Hsp70 family protein, partial [Clostridia bacterium]|nr:Hsp70 family protein [Clostridia bacterium]
DIDKAVKDAAQYAEADKKRKEEVDLRNGADQMVFQSEKILQDEGDKFSDEDKSNLQSKIDALKASLQGSNVDDIKAKQDDLQKVFYDISAKLYQQAGAQDAGAGFDPNAAGFDPNAAAGDAGFGGSDANGADDVNFTDVD